MSESRDRGRRIEVTGNVEEVMTILDHFLKTESQGMVGFRKDGDSVKLWASSEAETII